MSEPGLRPEVRNTLNAALLGELETALRRLEDDEATRVIVLRGEGDAREGIAAFFDKRPPRFTER